MSDNDLVKRGVIKERMIARGWKHPDSTVTEFVEDDLPAVPTDGDLVSRNWLLVEYDRQHEGSAGKARKLIEDAPAVPREMTAREYIITEERCKSWCLSNGGCESCCYHEFCWADAIEPEEYLRFYTLWAKEHPERSEK